MMKHQGADDQLCRRGPRTSMKVLVIAPHMDDEVLGCGGTIARHVENGNTVTVCVVAHRAYNHKYDPLENQQELAACNSARSVLGYQEFQFLDLPDERLDEGIQRIVIPLEAVLEKAKPEIVYVNHRGDVNQDHQAVFRATMVACRAQGLWCPRRFCCYEVPSSTDQMPGVAESAFVPNHYVDIASFLDKKLQALQCYQREARPFPHPRSPEAIKSLATKRGVEMGARAAEAFIILRDLWRQEPVPR